MMADPNFIQFVDLGLFYGVKQALSEINLTIPELEITSSARRDAVEFPNSSSERRSRRFPSSKVTSVDLAARTARER
jgi:hypothetical protein